MIGEYELVSNTFLVIRSQLSQLLPRLVNGTHNASGYFSSARLSN